MLAYGTSQNKCRIVCMLQGYVCIALFHVTVSQSLILPVKIQALESQFPSVPFKKE